MAEYELAHIKHGCYDAKGGIAKQFINVQE
jgi:hypothetical protein